MCSRDSSARSERELTILASFYVVQLMKESLSVVVEVDRRGRNTPTTTKSSFAGASSLHIHTTPARHTTMADPTKTLPQLSTSLATLEEALAPLLATPFEEVSEGLEPLVKARLDVMVGYVVHDLIWSELSLRLRG